VIAFLHWLLPVVLSASVQTTVPLEIIYSNDVMGELEPCGCRTDPLGGLIRKANLLTQMRGSASSLPMIQTDSGNLLFSSTTIPDLLKPQAELQARFLLRGLTLLKHDVITVGEKDFALGSQTLIRLAGEATAIQWVSANLYQSSKRIFKPWIILERGGQKVAITGLQNPKHHWPKNIRVSDPISELRKIAPQLKKADWIVILSSQGLDGDKKLASQLRVMGLKSALILGAHSQSFLQEPLTQEGHSLFQSSFRNQYVGRISLSPASQSSGPKSFTHALLPLSASLNDQTPSEIGKLVELWKKETNELNQKRDTTLSLSTESQVARTTAAKNPPKTFPSCAECHWNQFDFWRGTRHAQALLPLIKKNQAQNKECLSCHSVGLGVPGGFESVQSFAREISQSGTPHPPLAAEELEEFLKAMREAKNLNTPVKLRRTDATPAPLHRVVGRLEHAWSPVQCENCHQLSDSHPIGQLPNQKVNPSTCLGCHTPTQAPEWYSNGKNVNPEILAKKLKMISCPSGEYRLELE
jgi:hypothetical protein